MFQRLIEMFTAPAVAPPGGEDGIELAVAALLIEAARSDDQFGTGERSTIRSLLARRFDLTGPETDRLLAAAADAQDRSVGLYRHIRRITDGYDAPGRVGVIEMLWEVAYADRRLDPEEDALIRRIAGLIHVSDPERGAARQRVLARRGA
ncbi:TerB family tellurite resistance protein [Stella sp.]|uniref:tellurite resistance TerB family protein n=1 Tax=Stella sp. TaxID=2912054 RepID=UPI0035B3528A